jgi:UDP-GlcNAc3NAcA epimerase
LPKRTILSVVGARPQFVKAAVVSRAIAMQGGLAEQIVHTGQHFDANMSAVFFDELGIPAPTFHLGIGGGTHGRNTGRMIEALEQVMLDQKPAVVMVFGDTDSTLAASLAASKLHIPVAHVEAGLRSFNRRMPEEINRVLCDHVSDMLFTPTKVATDNLRAEGLDDRKMINVGDVMFDAVKLFSPIAQERSMILDELGLEAGSYVLATLHRQETTDNAKSLGDVLAGLAGGNLTVLPLHPRTRRRIAEHGLQLPPKIKVIDPVGYLDMMVLEANAKLIATDSGGVQKEAFFHGVPCITMREETEWVELLDIGANTLVGTDREAIAAALNRAHVRPAQINLYGDGDASSKIAAALAAWAA